MGLEPMLNLFAKRQTPPQSILDAFRAPPSLFQFSDRYLPSSKEISEPGKSKVVTIMLP